MRRRIGQGKNGQISAQSNEIPGKWSTENLKYGYIYQSIGVNCSQIQSSFEKVKTTENSIRETRKIIPDKLEDEILNKADDDSYNERERNTEVKQYII